MNDLTLDSDLNDGITIDGPSRTYLQETAKWAKFLAIVGFVGVGLMILMGLFMGTIMGTLMQGMGSADITGGLPMAFMSIFYIVLALIYLMPCLYLYRFANKMKLALAQDNQTDCTEAFMNLKSLYKFFGILTAIFLGLYALVIVIALIAAVVAG